MIRQIMFTLFISELLLAACAGQSIPGTGAYPEPGSPGDIIVASPYPGFEQPYPAPWEPAVGDENLVRGEVFIEEQEVIVLESFPPQFMLKLSGALPTPCHQLRVKVNDPNPQNQVQVEVYSLAKPDEICIQVLKPFEESIPLGSYTSGKYEVLVNGKQAGVIAP
ncbi:MAG TPA: hypothetical protein VI755_09895 [Anaerolineales bacterium]|nr:hypothetical protein [Anaerolineales bacterium]